MKGKLNPRERKFCILRASGMGQMDAYKKAGYKPNATAASLLEKKLKITKEIVRLQDKVESKVFDLKVECQKLSPAAIRKLAGIMKGSKSEKSILAAIAQLLDRGHGKPSEKLIVELPELLIK